MARKRTTDAKPASLPEPRFVRWWLLAGGVFAGAVAALALPYLDLLPATRPGSTTVTVTVVNAAAVVVLTVWGLYCIGRGRLELASYRASQLDVDTFRDERPAEPRPDESAIELTARFKRKLNESRIYTPTAVPGVASSYDFIQIVENAGDAAQGWWRAATRLVRLVRPPAVFQVSGTVRPGGKPGHHKLIVELVRLPRYAASPLIIEDDNWDRLLERAANSIAAMIMPRSRHCRTDQWAAWRGVRIPSGLFDAYQRANQFDAERRYDEALAEYYRALRYDPLNVYIRLEIGYLQERLDMYLDALVTYDDVITICSRDHPELSEWWNSPDFVLERSGSAARREVALLLARYRHALVLGLGDWIAEQWWMRSERCTHKRHWDAREMRRAQLRLALQQRFERYLLTDVELDEPTVLDRASFHRQLLAEPAGHNDEERAQKLRWYLCILSQYELERLVQDCRPRLTVHFLKARRLSRLVSRNALDVCLVWAALRRAMAVTELGTERVRAYPTAFPLAQRIPQLAKLFDDGYWPPVTANLTAAVGALHLDKPRGAAWNEHYNAACAYAVAMLPTGPLGAPSAGRSAARKDVDRDGLARNAVRELHRAAADSHSSYLARRQAWVMSEDPDLAALRGQPRFTNFEIMTFSPERPTSLRPRRVHVWEQVAFMGLLIGRAAECLGHIWQTQAERDADGVTRTRALDLEAWNLVGALAVSRRDWYSRFGMIEALRDWSDEFAIPDTVVSFPAFTEEVLVARYASIAGESTVSTLRESAIDLIDTVTGAYITKCDERMDELARMLRRRSAGGTQCPWNPITITAMEPPAANRVHRQNGYRLHLARSPHREQCQLRAERWGALSAWFDDTSVGRPVTDRADAFAATLPPVPAPPVAVETGIGTN